MPDDEGGEKNTGRLRTVGVEGAHMTLNVLPPPSVTFFLLIGNITEVNGGGATGKFYCRGVGTDPEAWGVSALVDGTPKSGGLNFVDQRFRIDGQGQIYGSGDDGDPPLIVVRGTGDFKKARGTYFLAGGNPIPFGDGRLDFTFDLDD